MSQEFDAIYERGIFRPLEQVDLPEKAKVHLQVQEAGQSAPTSMTDVALAQKAALRELLDWVRSRPTRPDDENFSVRDHDRVLYGWQK